MDKYTLKALRTLFILILSTAAVAFTMAFLMAVMSFDTFCFLGAALIFAYICLTFVQIQAGIYRSRDRIDSK